MSSCLKRETVQAFLDRELSAAEMESAEQHVSVCAACQRRLDNLRATSATVDALLTSLVPEELTVAIPNGAMADAVASMSCKAAGSRLRWALIVSVGALAVASSFLFIMIHRPHTAPTPSITKSQAPAPRLLLRLRNIMLRPCRSPFPRMFGSPSPRKMISWRWTMGRPFRTARSCGSICQLRLRQVPGACAMAKAYLLMCWWTKLGKSAQYDL